MAPETELTTQAAANDTPKLRVFISYSRAELEFVDRMRAALETKGIEALVDRDDIEKGEEWWARIKELISEADSVLFVLSPTSVASPVCNQEVEFAQSLNKRFLPVVAQEFSSELAPDALARLNYTYFIPNLTAGASGDFNEAVDQLTRTLETDIRWIREHTRLGSLAQRWQQANRASDLMLRGAELAAAETWFTTRPKNAPDPTDAHRLLITESRRWATRKQRYWLIGSVAVSMAALVLALTAYSQRIQADKRRFEAQTAQILQLLNLSVQAERDQDKRAALRFAIEALPRQFSAPEKPVLPAAVNNFLRRYQDGQAHIIAPTLGNSTAVSLDSSRRTLAVAGKYKDASSTIALWDTDQLNPISMKENINEQIQNLWLSTFGQNLIVQMKSGQTQVYDRKLRLRYSLDRPRVSDRDAPLNIISLSKSKNRFSRRDASTKLAVRTVDSEKPINVITVPEGIRWHGLLGDGQTAVVLTNKNSLVVINTLNGETSKEAFLNRTVTHIERSNTHEYLILITKDLALTILDASSLHKTDVPQFQKSINRRQAALVSKATSDTPKTSRALKRFSVSFTGIRTDKEDKYVGIGVKINLSLDIIHQVPKHQGEAARLVSQQTFRSGRDFLVLIANTTSGRVSEIYSEEDAWHDIRFSPRSNRAFALGGRGHLGVIDLAKETDHLLDSKSIVENAMVRDIRIASDQRTALILGGDSTLRFVDLQTIFQKLPDARDRCKPIASEACLLGLLSRPKLPSTYVTTKSVDDKTELSLVYGGPGALKFSQSLNAWQAVYLPGIRRTFTWNGKGLRVLGTADISGKKLYEVGAGEEIIYAIFNKSGTFSALAIRKKTATHSVYYAITIRVDRGKGGEPVTSKIGSYKFPLSEDSSWLLVHEWPDGKVELVSISDNSISIIPVESRRTRTFACPQCQAKVGYFINGNNLLVGGRDGTLNVVSLIDGQLLYSTFAVAGTLTGFVTSGLNPSHLALTSNRNELVAINLNNKEFVNRSFDVSQKILPILGTAKSLIYQDKNDYIRMAKPDTQFGVAEYLAEADSDLLGIRVDEANTSLIAVQKSGNSRKIDIRSKKLEELVWWSRATLPHSFRQTSYERRNEAAAHQADYRKVLEFRDVGKRCDLVGADLFDPNKATQGRAYRVEAENREALGSCLAAIREYPHEPRYRHQAGLAAFRLKNYERAIALLKPNVEIGYPASVWCMGEVLIVTGDISQGWKLIERASRYGIAGATYRHGSLISSKLSSSSDKDQMLVTQLFQRSAEAGFPLSHIVLADEHRQGTYSPKDLRKALFHYGMAGELMRWLNWNDSKLRRRIDFQRSGLAWQLGRKETINVWQRVEKGLWETKNRVEAGLWNSAVNWVRRTTTDISYHWIGSKIDRWATGKRPKIIGPPNIQMR